MGELSPESFATKAAEDEAAFGAKFFRRGVKLIKGEDNLLYRKTHNLDSFTVFASKLDGINYKREAVARTNELRSQREEMLLPLKSAFSRKGKIRVGNDKSFLLPEQYSKLHALDAPYVRQQETRHLIRVDIDSSFRSEEAFFNVLLAAFGGDFTMMPYLATGAIDPQTGTISGMHLYWFLTSPVTTTGKARQAPQLLLRAVENLLTERLEAIGADQNGLMNSMHGKNPFSELWDNIYIGNVITSLGDLYAQLQDLTVDDDALNETFTSAQPDDRIIEAIRTRRASANKQRKKGSNPYFASAVEIAREAIRTRAVKDETELAYLIETKLQEEFGAVKLFTELAERVASYWIEMIDKKNRGAAKHLIHSADDEATRKTKGALYSAEIKVKRTVQAIHAVMEEMSKTGTSMIKADIVRACIDAGMSRSTAYNRVDDAIETYPKIAESPDYIDGKLITSEALDPSPIRCIDKREEIITTHVITANSTDKNTSLEFGSDDQSHGKDEKSHGSTETETGRHLSKLGDQADEPNKRFRLSPIARYTITQTQARLKSVGQKDLVEYLHSGKWQLSKREPSYDLQNDRAFMKKRYGAAPFYPV